MPKRLIFLALFALLILPACNLFNAAVQPTGGAPAPDTTGSAGNPAGDGLFSRPADPLNVTPTLDSTNQAEALISPDGGSLSAVGADGTRFTLEVPAGALVSETQIRLTPVRALDGMPFGSSPYAVQLEPEGTQFFADATLTITPAAAIPLEEQLFFSYERLGENLALAIPDPAASEIRLRVPHFSGYGVTKGLLADIEPVRARLGGSAEARLQSAVAEELTRARQAQLLGGEETSTLDFASYFQQFEEQVVKPRLAAAGESCTAGRLALQTVLGLERQKQLLGVSEGGGQLFDPALMDTVAGVCMQEEYELCRDEHIVHRIVPAWLGLERQYQLLGMGEGTSPALEQARDLVRRCQTFELQFHSEASFDDGEGGGYTSAVEAKVKIQLDPAAFSNRASAPLVNTAFEYVTPGCSTESQRGGGTFEAMGLGFVVDTKSPADELGYVRDLKLAYFPGNTSEVFTVTCEDTPPFTMPATPLWTGVFLPLHESELDMAGGGFSAENWEVMGGEYFARLEWIRDDAGEGITETGTFKLYHKPE